MILACALMLTGCSASPDFNFSNNKASTPKKSVSKVATKSDPIISTVAYINGSPVKAKSMLNSMYEIAGGESLANEVIDRGIQEDLDLRHEVLTMQMVETEKQYILDSLDPDDLDQATRMLNKLRQQKGLGEYAFHAMLKRNAGLRKIVSRDVNMTPVLLQQEYKLRYGDRYQARMIVMPDLRSLQHIRRQAEQGADFALLANTNSTDISARQGGLLPAISPVDSNYPKTIRKTLTKLKPGELSDALAVDNGYAFLKLERVVPASKLKYDEVEDQLKKAVRTRVEATLMRQKATEYITKARVTVLEPVLLGSWKRQKGKFTEYDQVR